VKGTEEGRGEGGAMVKGKERFGCKRKGQRREEVMEETVNQDKLRSVSGDG